MLGATSVMGAANAADGTVPFLHDDDDDDDGALSDSEVIVTIFLFICVHAYV